MKETNVCFDSQLEEVILEELESRLELVSQSGCETITHPDGTIAIVCPVAKTPW